MVRREALKIELTFLILSLDEMVFDSNFIPVGLDQFVPFHSEIIKSLPLRSMIIDGHESCYAEAKINALMVAKSFSEGVSTEVSSHIYRSAPKLHHAGKARD